MPRGTRDEGYRVRTRLIIERVFDRAERKGWNRAYAIDVLMASLSPARIKAGVVGPCFYCFDDLAATVDHIVPVSEGGTDDRSNLVSCCWDCNNLKRTTTLQTFLHWHPFGRDRDRRRRWLDACKNPEYQRLSDLHHEWLEEQLRLDPERYRVPRWAA